MNTIINDDDINGFNNRSSYNSHTGDFLWVKTSGKGFKGESIGCINQGGYLQTKIKGKVVLVHRLIWRLHYGEWPEKYIDHINGIITDNRILNLREVSPSGNMQNIKIPKNNTSGYLGVSFCKASGKWKSAIKFKRKSTTIGYYLCPIEAHNSYLAKKKEIHLINPVPRENYRGKNEYI